VTRRALLIIAAALVVVGVAIVGAATRPSEDRVALAIQGAERPNGTVILHVECADDITIEQRPDPEGSGLEQVTVWGSPRTGTCDPTDRAALSDLREDRFVDGATSQVVTVEDSCLPTATC
jgi:hypothetical protein